MALFGKNLNEAAYRGGKNTGQMLLRTLARVNC